MAASFGPGSSIPDPSQQFVNGGFGLLPASTWGNTQLDKPSPVALQLQAEADARAAAPTPAPALYTGPAVFGPSPAPQPLPAASPAAPAQASFGPSAPQAPSMLSPQQVAARMMLARSLFGGMMQPRSAPMSPMGLNAPNLSAGLYGQMTPQTAATSGGLGPYPRTLPNPMRQLSLMPTRFANNQMPSPYPSSPAAAWARQYAQQVPFLPSMMGAYNTGTLAPWSPMLPRAMGTQPTPTSNSNAPGVASPGAPPPDPTTDPNGYINWLINQGPGGGGQAAFGPA